MLQSFSNVFKIPELKRRLLFTMAMLAIYRIGAHVPTPGINTLALASFIKSAAKGTIFGFFDMFSGGAFSNLTIFTLGIMPYISASIILQLLAVVVPYLERLSKEGEQGRRKITQYTRYGTVVLSVIQSLGIAIGLESMEGGMFVRSPGWAFRIMTVITLTAGTAFIMWIGEQISERGIGNGISLIISAGIVAGLPGALLNSYDQIRTGDMKFYVLLAIIAIMFIVVAGVVLMQQSQRRIPVQYPKRVVGRRIMGGQSTHVPLRINTAGVIPVIFASSIIMFPLTVIKFLRNSLESDVWRGVFDAIEQNMMPGAVMYTVVYVILIVFFCYFYTAIIFNPTDLAENMKKNGGFIPGIRPGKRTADFIDRALTRVTLAGAIFLSAISVLPTFLIRWFNVPFYFGGTALLIVVGVGLDTIQQMESHLVMRHYEGFLRGSKRIRGRRS
ncbi:preprotein translocase subunit SecY [bacterium]|nr:preprotein translocase subunit SecY [candidate division CSSED10-310 bacterium]